MAETKLVLMQGNEACVKGAIAGGMTFYAGYPITPSTEIAELCSQLLQEEILLRATMLYLQILDL